MSDPKDFKDRLLTDDGKWWEFLDPETYEVKQDLPGAQRASSDLLDWSSKRKTERARGPVGFGFFYRCDVCGRGIPPDLTFCLHCGGYPRSTQRPQLFTLVVTRLESSEARDKAVELFVRSGRELKAMEVAKMLDELPAVFNIGASRQRVAALVARLAEMGVLARSFSVDDPSIPWIRETLEAIARDTTKLIVSVVGAVVALAMLVVWWPGALLTLVVLGLMFWRQLQWYKARYEIDADAILMLLSGLDAHSVELARELLRGIQDRGARESLTVCLMEYYTLLRQFRAYEPEFGPVLSNAKLALEELLAQVLTVCARYQQLERFLYEHEPAMVRQRIAQIRTDRPRADPKTGRMLDKELAHLEKQLQDLDRMEALAVSFRRRLAALATQLETLRARVASVRTSKVARWEEIEMEDILRELDEELEIVEKTFVEMRT